MSAELPLVREVLGELSAVGQCWLFGGWAEQLRGMRSPGPAQGHRPLARRRRLRRARRAHRRTRLRGDRGQASPHKRAWLVDDVMVEAFLVRRDEDGPYTAFAHGPIHRWPQILGSLLDGLPVASAATLASYRAAHARLHAR